MKRVNLVNVTMALVGLSACVLLVVMVAYPDTIRQRRQVRPEQAPSYGESTTAIFDKYQPMLKRMDEIRDEKGTEAADAYYHENIGGPMLRDLNELRKKYGKEPMPYKGEYRKQ